MIFVDIYSRVDPSSLVLNCKWSVVRLAVFIIFGKTE